MCLTCMQYEIIQLGASQDPISFIMDNTVYAMGISGT